MYEVGKRIKECRKNKRLSQKEFARMIGAKNTAVSNWETGLTRPDVDTLAKICVILDVSADELLDIKLPPDPGGDDDGLAMAYCLQVEQLKSLHTILPGLKDSPPLHDMEE